MNLICTNVNLYSFANFKKTSIYFGSYPQTKVSSKRVVSRLNNLAGTLPTSTNTYKWTDYGYYIEESISSYMYYIDIDIDNDGKYDYRGVYFISYRPFFISWSSLKVNSWQNRNGYNTNTVYWFKYQPIKWNILKTDNNKALIISDLILDSQDYYYAEDTRNGATDYQGNSTTDNVYANNYMYSHIRSWLNQTFYETAFSTLEKQIIETTTVDNSIESTSDSNNRYACSNTNDKIFLLSYSEVKTYYASNKKRIAKGSNYAKCQGLFVYLKSYVCYWLRSPKDIYDFMHKYYALNIFMNGMISHFYIHGISDGVRPVCWINL